MVSVFLSDQIYNTSNFSDEPASSDSLMNLILQNKNLRNIDLSLKEAPCVRKREKFLRPLMKFTAGSLKPLKIIEESSLRLKNNLDFLKFLQFLRNSDLQSITINFETQPKSDSFQKL